MEQEDGQPVPSRATQATVGEDCTGGFQRTRDRQERQVAQQQDAATPAAREHQERAAVIDMYANAHEQRLADERAQAENQRRKRDEAKAKADRIAAENARVAEAKRIDALRDKEARERQMTTFLQNQTRSEITALVRQYDMFDRLDELQALVKQQGLGMASVLAWETACRILGKK